MEDNIAVERIKNNIERKALKYYREGGYGNPFPEHSPKYSVLLKGCHKYFQEQIEKLKKECLCPCCGQVTQSDIDW